MAIECTAPASQHRHHGESKSETSHWQGSSPRHKGGITIKDQSVDEPQDKCNQKQEIHSLSLLHGKAIFGLAGIEPQTASYKEKDPLACSVNI